MKLQKTTLFLLGLALALGGFVYFNELKNQSELEVIQNKPAAIFNFQEEDIIKLIITTQKQTLEFSRSEGKQFTWHMKQPKNVPANDGVVSFLLNLLVLGKSQRSFTVSADNLSQYGLQPPFAKIKIILRDRQEYHLTLGKADFENKYLYASIEPQSNLQQTRQILLVSKNFQYAISERTLQDWQKSPN